MGVECSVKIEVLISYRKGHSDSELLVNHPHSWALKFERNT